MIRKRTGPHRAGGDRTPAQRRSGGPLTAAMERDFPEPDDVNDLDEADELDGRRDGGGADSMSFLHRLGVALVVLAVALGVGVGAGVVWEKVRPSGRTAMDAPAVPSPSASAAASAPAATGPGASAAASTGQSAAGQIAVPADWAPYTDPLQKATFSHPPVWKQRRDNTGIFYGEPGTVSDYGPQMIGVARIAGADQTAALTHVQAGEFDAVSGLTKERSGAATDTSGQPTQELAGSYDREGQRVSYLMRTVATNGAVYVLIARVSTSAAATLNTLMGALRASFSPAA
ncbi:LpqN/LpqT family lipoprotein [Frankia sp. ArI3]|uniref:LpqN/LpqT family lipoprotein n=1 Tax=Frankia sp. ArI3 TaxID=1858 RepID=UPI0018FED2DD|nr:LpqN/LpqT family lipoprotein [Frankia sp. ArI3]